MILEGMIRLFLRLDYVKISPFEMVFFMISDEGKTKYNTRKYTIFDVIEFNSYSSKSYVSYKIPDKKNSWSG
uniref:KTSC domain-containing protein n=1 Tax=Caenorhabditis tropicalis TaxID=1561998 RepID=A0A1I7U6R7_9PELO